MPAPRWSDLCDDMRPAAERLYEQATAELGPMRLISVLRTPAEQAEKIAQGVSWTTRSRHLAQPGCGKAHAFDIAPVALMREKLWAPKHPDWNRLGEMGKSLGLQWGGDWSGGKRDPGHFERIFRHASDDLKRV